MKLPEPVVNSVDPNLTGSAVAGLFGDETLRENQRADSIKVLTEVTVGSKVRRKLLAKEAGRRHDVIGFAKPLEHQVAETAPHRVADQQRARQHGDSRRDAEHDGRVRAPVISEASEDEETRLHNGPTLFSLPPASSNRSGNCDASLRLCVTTIRILRCCR